jgi:hypothetical protein
MKNILQQTAIVLCIVLCAACKTDNAGSPYYTALDFYTLKSDSTLTLLPHFKTFQQTTGVTCGPSCVLMVLDYFGKLGTHDEMELKALRGTKQDTTYLRHLLAIFNAVGGFHTVSTFDLQREDIGSALLLDFLRQGIPVIIGTNEWEGHWQIVIGYDTRGTDTTLDDVLILADPYDRTDHALDGYSITSFQKLYEGSWSNRYDPDFGWGLLVAAAPIDYQPNTTTSQ